MRINYKNTALGLIDDPDNFNFGFPDPEITPKLNSDELRSFGNHLLKASPHVKSLCGNNIQYVCGSFYESFQKASRKLKDLAYKEEIEDCGVLLTGGFTEGYTHMHTIYYSVITVKCADGKLFYNIVFMDFSKHAKSDMPVLDVYTTMNLHEDESDVDVKSLLWDGYMSDGRDASYWQSFIILFCLFKKYCDIETKVVEPKNRRAKVGGNKYLNETDKRISILDCTWFTNLVVSGKFGVSGHLRWQRHGPNNSLKKLIWIDEFEKDGYTRKAKMTIDNS